jgi:hypothetical protein
VQSFYVLATGSNPELSRARAQALGCVTVSVGDPTGAAAVFPSAVVTSSALPPAVFPDDAGEATVAQVSAAQAAATAAEATATANEVALLQKAAAALAANQSYLAVAVPSQAQTTAQIAALTRAVDALCYLVLGQYSTTAGT